MPLDSPFSRDLDFRFPAFQGEKTNYAIGLTLTREFWIIKRIAYSMGLTFFILFAISCRSTY